METLDAALEILKRRIRIECDALHWAAEGNKRHAASWMQLGKDAPAEVIALCKGAWRRDGVLGHVQPGESSLERSSRLFNNLQAWHKRRLAALCKSDVLLQFGASEVYSRLHQPDESSSQQPPAHLPSLPPPPIAAALPAPSVLPPPAPRPAVPPAPQPAVPPALQPPSIPPLTLLPPIELNRAVAAMLGAATVEALMGAAHLQQLKQVHALPESCVATLHACWDPIAACQAAGALPARSACTSAAIFQSWMVALVHADLAGRALQQEQERRVSDAQQLGRKPRKAIKPVELRGAIGGIYQNTGEGCAGEEGEG